MKTKITSILHDLNQGNISLQDANDKIHDLLGIISKLDFDEIESLVQMKHFDDSDYGNSPKECKKLIENTRKQVGYTKQDLIKYSKY